MTLWVTCRHNPPTEEDISDGFTPDRLIGYSDKEDAKAEARKMRAFDGEERWVFAMEINGDQFVAYDRVYSIDESQ